MSILDSAILRAIASKEDKLVAGAVSVVAILATTAIYYFLGSSDNEDEFPKLRGIQLYHAWSFFTRRHDFLFSNFERHMGKGFSFHVLSHKVIALTGNEARHTFFSHPNFDLNEGFKIFKGAAPRVSDVDKAKEDTQGFNISLFNKRLNKLLNKNRIQSVLPTLLQDITGKADLWGNGGESGRIDPFTEVYDLVFLMTARMTTCHDLTKNGAELKKIADLMMSLQKSATPLSVLLRWLPSPARKSLKESNTTMYTMLYTYVERRRRAEPTDDAIDILIADGETTRNIVEFMMVVLFAGIANSGIIACWMLVDIAIHTEWRAKCKEEIQGIISRYVGDIVSPAPLREKLAAIPLSAWEDELPILDACIRESQRISLSSVSLRRNAGEDCTIGGKVVRRGDFVAYAFTDVHLNPEQYPDPYKYDPGRWLRPDPVPSTPYPFVGWGAGRHPCPGIRVAKLEMKLILSLFVTRYEFELVDKDGKFPDRLPVPDRNYIHQSRPLGDTRCYFDFKKVQE